MPADVHETIVNLYIEHRRLAQDASAADVHKTIVNQTSDIAAPPLGCSNARLPTQ